jgi:serine protease AprX
MRISAATFKHLSLRTLAIFVVASTFVALLLSGGARAATSSAYVPADLLAQAAANPDASFSVILQGAPGSSADASASAVAGVQLVDPGKAAGLRRKLSLVNGVAADVTGKQLVKLAKVPGISAITPDARVRLSGGLSSKQQWPFVSGVARGWASVTNGSLAQPPAIAVVDSGVDTTRTDFGARVVKQVNLASLVGNSPGDGYGHGTFVAGIAAGSATGYTGAAPSANVVSIDVMDDQGMALTSDVIAAADWIYQNKSAYNIRVANFSLHSTAPASVFWSPLDRAVEKLWFSGVVVVAASGNYAVNGQASGVPFAPGNDPFIITVGANDINGSVATNDDVAAPWSAFGYTLDGFAKPDLAAPGRYLVGPVPPTSTLALTRPGSVVAPGYIQLSGTSFAAPTVAGAAAYVLAVHPSWTPDQVKGALMLSAKATPQAASLSEGVGELDASHAVDVTNPPNPNLALDRFLVADPAGGPTPVFDAASWGSTASTDASWGSASWGSASWGSASWGSASWGSASWGSLYWSAASWGTASWGSGSNADASWGSASWGSAATADNAAGEVGTTPILDSIQLLEAQAELGLQITNDGAVSPTQA